MPVTSHAQTFGWPPAQTLGKMRRADRYEDTFIHERKPFSWPGGKTLAVWIAPNVEVWHFDSAVGTGISPNPANRVPDVINYAWREYGMRVGLWRHGRRPGRRRRQGHRRAEFAGLRRRIPRRSRK